jgi:hypothetical protein
MSDGPKIGIWWDDGKRLVVLSHLPGSESHDGRHVDSDLNHFEEWDKVAKKFGKSSRDEYFCIPRGRVILDTKRNRSVIYHGSSTNKARLVKIAEEFRLENWIAAVDDHYEMGDGVDALFDDD